MKRTFIWLSLAVVFLLLTSTLPNKAAPIESSTQMPTTGATSASTDSAPTLRSLAEKRNFYMGAAVAYSPLKSLQPYRDTLRTQYNMTPEQYREKWGLAADYPMVAPSYAAARSQLAKQMGLGQQRRRRK